MSKPGEKVGSGLRLDKEAIYEVLSATDVTVVIAMLPTLVEQEEERTYITWFDTVKDRMFEVKQITRNEEHRLSFVSVQGNQYTLQQLTLEAFRERIIPLLSWKEEANAIQTEAEMRHLFFESMTMA